MGVVPLSIHLVQAKKVKVVMDQLDQFSSLLFLSLLFLTLSVLFSFEKLSLSNMMGKNYPTLKDFPSSMNTIEVGAHTPPANSARTPSTIAFFLGIIPLGPGDWRMLLLLVLRQLHMFLML